MLVLGAGSRPGKTIVHQLHLPATVQKESGRITGEVHYEGQLSGDVIRRSRNQHRIGDVIPVDELLYAVAIVIQIARFKTEANNFEPLSFVLAVERVENRSIVVTIRAPATGDIDQDNLSL